MFWSRILAKFFTEDMQSLSRMHGTWSTSAKALYIKSHADIRKGQELKILVPVHSLHVAMTLYIKCICMVSTFMNTIQHRSDVVIWNNMAEKTGHCYLILSACTSWQLVGSSPQTQKIFIFLNIDKEKTSSGEMKNKEYLLGNYKINNKKSGY